MDQGINWHNSDGEFKPWTPTMDDFEYMLKLEFLQALLKRIQTDNG